MCATSGFVLGGSTSESCFGNCQGNWKEIHAKSILQKISLKPNVYTELQLDFWHLNKTSHTDISSKTNPSVILTPLNPMIFQLILFVAHNRTIYFSGRTILLQKYSQLLTNTYVLVRTLCRIRYYIHNQHHQPKPPNTQV